MSAILQAHVTVMQEQEDEILRLEARVFALGQDLKEAAEMFRRYENLHRVKGTEEAHFKAEVNRELANRFELTLAGQHLPIDMVLHCPKCHEQHIDAPMTSGHHELCGKPWANPPHRSHLCHYCGHVWRPADVPTNGIAAVKTRGKNDSEVAS